MRLTSSRLRSFFISWDFKRLRMHSAFILYSLPIFMTNHSASASLFVSKVKANLLRTCIEYEPTLRIHLRHVLVNYITIRLYAPQEASKESFNAG